MTPYLMSFTAGALLHHESVRLAERLADVGDWDAVRREALEENLLQMRTLSAARRILQEVSGRLEELTEAQLALLRAGTRRQQQHLLWLAICRRYRFIREFAVEVVREKFLRLDLTLSYAEYDVFFSDTAEWHPELAALAESTRKKQRQIVFRMLREAGLLSAADEIQRAMLTPAEVTVIAAHEPADLQIFPLPLAELQRELP